MSMEKAINICIGCIVWICVIIVSVFISGCSQKKISKDKVAEMEYVIVEQSDIPSKLAEEIASKKEQEFKISYKDGKSLYIAIGYGKQDTGGYKVQVDDLYLAKNSVQIRTSLIGPRENELVLKACTYPYVVICTDNKDVDVLYD